MSEEYVSKLQEDLRKRLNRLRWMHNEPALHVAEHFAELRNQVDYDAEKQIEMLREEGKEEEIVTINGKRIEFIRILDELEKRTCRQSKPQKPASDIYASLEQRVEAFKDSSSSLDDLEDSYLQLVQEINDETDRAEKRLFGEQTIIYWPHWHESELGSLVYFDDVFLSKLDIDNLLYVFAHLGDCVKAFIKCLFFKDRKTFPTEHVHVVSRYVSESSEKTFLVTFYNFKALWYSSLL